MAQSEQFPKPPELHEQAGNESLLTPNDAEWLNRLATRTLDDDDYTYLNDRLVFASHQTVTGGPKVLVFADVIMARMEFYDRLGFFNPQHPLYRPFMCCTQRQAGMPPPATFVGAQRILASRGIDGLRAIHHARRTTLISMTPQLIAQRLESLEQVAISAQEVNDDPDLLIEGDPERIADSQAMLTSFGMLLETVKKVAPELQLVPPHELLRRKESLDTWGFDTLAILRAHPRVLVINPLNLQNKLIRLHQVGIDVERILRINGGVFTLGIDSLERKIQNITDAGIDGVHAVNAYPRILASSEKTVNKRIAIMRRLAKLLRWRGDLTDLIEHSPQLLAVSEARIFFLGALATKTDRSARAMQPSTIQSALGFNSELHMLALTDPKEPYSVSLAGRYRRIVPKPEQRQEVLKRLSSQQLRQRAGRTAVRHYLKYAPLSAEEAAEYKELKKL